MTRQQTHTHLKREQYACIVASQKLALTSCGWLDSRKLGGSSSTRGPTAPRARRGGQRRAVRISTMKLKELHSLMQDMAPFDSSRLKVQLEQYPTGADIASRMLFTVRVPWHAAPCARCSDSSRASPPRQQAQSLGTLVGRAMLRVDCHRQ